MSVRTEPKDSSEIRSPLRSLFVATALAVADDVRMTFPQHTHSNFRRAHTAHGDTGRARTCSLRRRSARFFRSQSQVLAKRPLSTCDTATDFRDATWLTLPQCGNLRSRKGIFSPAQKHEWRTYDWLWLQRIYEGSLVRNQQQKGSRHGKIDLFPIWISRGRLRDRAIDQNPSGKPGHHFRSNAGGSRALGREQGHPPDRRNVVALPPLADHELGAGTGGRLKPERCRRPRYVGSAIDALRPKLYDRSKRWEF